MLYYPFLHFLYRMYYRSDINIDFDFVAYKEREETTYHTLFYSIGGKSRTWVGFSC